MKENLTKKEKFGIFIIFMIPISMLIIIILPSLFVCKHNWKETTGATACEKIQTCSLCGEIKKNTDHTWVGATCQKPGVCSRCGEVGYTTSHEYAFGKCKSCGESETFYTFTSDDDDDDFWFAVTSAQNLVKKELKSPSTAKFSYDDEEYTVKKNGHDWKVSGYVDAQNSFGSSIRTYWTAIFTMGDTSGSTYKVYNHIVTFS